MFTKTEKAQIKEDVIMSACSMLYGALLWIMFGVWIP